MKKRLYLLSMALTPFLFASCEKDKEADVTPTPDKQTLILNSISQDTTLVDIFEDEEIPDYVVDDNIEIKAKLTINPGVIIAVAADKGIVVQQQGIVIANGGSGEEQIVFRGKTEEAGFWRGILFESAAGLHKLDNVEIAHTGSRELLSGKKAALALFGNNQTKLSLLSCNIHDNAGYGLYVEEGAVLQDFSNNGFSRNSQAAILSSADQVHKLDAGSIYQLSGTADVEVYSSTIEGEGQLLWPAAHYRITGVNGLIVKGEWKIAPGALLEFGDNGQIQVNEGTNFYIHAVGTAEQKITFTAVNKTKGAWKGISIYSKSPQNKLENTHIAFGGSTTLYGKRANVYVLFATMLSMRNTRISQSSGYGIYLSEQAVINPDFEQANVFEQNNDGIYFKEN